MNLPRKEDLIAEKEVEELILEKKNPYYINQVSYGKLALFFAESDSSESQLKTSLNHAFSEESTALTSLDMKVLEQTVFTVYFRTGKPQALILQAQGKDDILNLVKRIKEVDKNEKERFDTPLYYSLRSLKDLSSLNVNSTFDCYFPVE